MSAILLILACGSAVLGCAYLALSQDRHWQAAGQTSTEPPTATRRLGAVLVAASLLLILVRDGISPGVLFWPFLLGAAAATIAGILARRPRLLGPLVQAVRRE